MYYGISCLSHMNTKADVHVFYHKNGPCAVPDFWTLFLDIDRCKWYHRDNKHMCTRNASARLLFSGICLRHMYGCLIHRIV